MFATAFGGADYDEILKIILNSLKPNGKAVFLEGSDAPPDAFEQLKLSGFQNPTRTPGNGIARQ